MQLTYLKGSDVVKCWGFFFPLLKKKYLFFPETSEAELLPEKSKKKQNLRQRDIHPNKKKNQPEYPPPKNLKINKCQKNLESLACKRVVLKFP